MNQTVGRVTPCAPILLANGGAHGVTRPTRARHDATRSRWGGTRFSWLLGVLLFCLTGCQHTSREIPEASRRSRPLLQSDGTAYIAIPLDAWFKEKAVVDSGLRTAQAVRDAFAAQVKHAYLGRRVESFDESLATARNGRCTYLIYPSVLRWEDRATEFTGRRDRVDIRIQVVEVASGEVLDRVTLRARSRWFTDGGDVPQDLLREPIQKYVASLFRPVYVPSALQ